MAGVPVGIDLCHNPLRVGCKLADSVFVQEGSKGANFNAGGEEKPHGAVAEPLFGVSEIPANISALVHCFEDARDVAKSFFGSSDIKRAVVVVPNDTDQGTRRLVEAAGNRAFIADLQVIPEHIAVAAAYADKTTLPVTDISLITIISSTAGACDVYVVSITHKSGMSHEYKAEDLDIRRREPYRESRHDEKKSESFFYSGGRDVTFYGHNFNVDKLAAYHVPHNSGGAPPDKHRRASEKVVFVGKSAELQKIREIITKGFWQIEEWNDFEDSEQLASYGAAVLAWKREPVSINDDLVPNF